MAEDFFGDITAEPKNDFFGDIKSAEPDQRGIVARTTEGFKGAYHPMLEGAIDKVAGENFKTEHPYLHAGAEALLNANPVSWLDKAITGVTAGVAGAAPGVGAGLAEAGGMSQANADRLQRDLGIIGQGALVEPGMGLAGGAQQAAALSAIARAARRAPERPAAPVPERPAEPVPPPEAVPRPAEEPAPAAPVEAPPEPTGPETARSPAEPRDLFDDLIRGVEEAQDVPPEAAKPTVDSRVEERPPAEARSPAEPATPDFFADITEEPPARTTERIPDEAVAAGERPAEAAQTPVPPEAAAPPVDSRPAKTIKGKPPETLSSYIARNGGLELTPEARDMGLHKRFIPGAGNVARKNGRSLDKFWRERLAEAGYIDRDPDGGIQRDIRGELYEKLGGSEPAYSKFDRPPELKVDPRSADIERQARIIEDAFEKEGLSKADIDTEALYEAADLLYRGEAKDPFEAYDRAATRLGDRDDAQPRGMRGEGTEIYPPGSEGTGPRIEKAIAGTGQRVQGARPARRVPRQEVSREDLIGLQKRFSEKIGEGVSPLDSVPLRTALNELDVRHLSGVPAAVARTAKQRLHDVVGDVPVHFITEADMARYRRPEGDVPAGLWSADQKTGRGFILINADMAADARLASHVVLHEGTHAAAYLKIEGTPTLKRQLRLLMDEMEKNTETQSGRKHYALTDEHEFLSEVFGNPEVQQVLSTIPAPAKLVAQLGGKGRIRTLWDTAVEMVRRALGIGPSKAARNLLNEVMRVGDEATNPRVGEKPGRAEAAAVRPTGDEGLSFTAADKEKIKTDPELMKIRLGQLLRDKAASKKRGVDVESSDYMHYNAQIRDLRRRLKEPAERALPKEEPGAEGKPQLVLPGAERVTAHELAKRKVAERQAQEKAQAKVPQKPMDEGLFGEGHKQTDLFDQPATKKERTELLAIREAGEEAISLKLAQRNRPKLAAITGFFGGRKINPTEVRVQAQDKFLRVKRMQDQWRRDNPGRDLPESMNVYQAESLSYGKIDKRIRQADKDHVDPLIKEIKDNGLTYKEAGDYITAKHIPERNRELRKINPSIPDPAGMSDAQAAAIVAAARPRQGNFDAVYNRFRRMVDETLNSQVLDGLITPQQAAAWRQRWPDYAPMRHTEVGEGWMSPGKGLEVKGKESKQALGRLSQADNPIAYGIEQMQRAIIRGEHNTVGRALGEFVSQTPEPGLWEFNKGPKIRYLDQKTNTVREMTDPLWRARDDVFTYKENGKEQSIWFTDPVYGRNLARAVKNLGTSEMNSFMRVVSAGTRTMARLSTSWSPEFMLSNFFRDAGETMMILPAEQKKGLARKFVKHLFPSIQGALRGQGSGTGFYAQKFREFENAGGRIGFLGMEGAESIAANVARKLRRLEGGPINTLRDWGQRAVDAIDVANNSIENGTRLSMFISAQELGISTPKAASIAREATVNFNRKGEMGSYISGLYMFANAGLQGQARMIQALKSHKVKAGAGALAGGGAVLAIYNIVAGGKDEDGSSKYSKLPAWTREANVILMHPDGSGRYFSIPVPFGFGMFKSIGDHTAAAVYGDEPAAKALNAMLWASIESFDPLGRDQNPVAHFTPTLLRPIPHIVMNQNAFGRPVNPDAMPWNKYGPDSERAFRTASPFSTALAQKLNTMTGGDKKTPGAIDVGPGTVDYMLQFIGGGLGRFVFNTATAGTRVYQGREWVPEKTPIVRRFYGEKSDQADRSLYFEEREKVRASDQRKQIGAERAAAGLFKTVDENRAKLLKQIDRVNGNESLTAAQKDEQVKTLQKQELKLMFTARRALERSRARAEQREPKFAEGGAVGDDYNTNLGNDEAQFQTWKSEHAPRDSGADYDLRGAYKAGVKPDQATGHWPDTYKKPNHPTFSDQSQYAKDAPEKAGRWEGETYIRPKLAEGGTVDDQRNARAVFARDKAAADAMLPASGQALEDRLNKGAWESRFGRYGTAPESENIEDRRAYGFRRTGRFIGGFKRGGDSGKV